MCAEALFQKQLKKKYFFQERFMCAEALFQPHLVDIDGFGVGEELFNVIQVPCASLSFLT
jgi:hypothetical protein